MDNGRVSDVNDDSSSDGMSHENAEITFVTQWEPPTPTNGTSGAPDIALLGTNSRVRNTITLFKAHKAALKANTEIFDAMLSVEEDLHADMTTPCGLPCVVMQETIAVLAIVIPSCYNIEGPCLHSVPQDTLMLAYEAANKYVSLRSKYKICMEIARRSASHCHSAFAESDGLHPG